MLENKSTKEKKRCFIITPIGDVNSSIRRHIDGIIDQAIFPALGNKYDVEVAHREYDIGSINDRIIRNIYEADLVIANLTGLNPNVMFELAIRYSFGKPAIVIAEDGTRLPFDVIDENTIFYVNDPTGAYDLKEKVVKFEERIDYEKTGYGPVYRSIKKIPLYDEIESGNNVPSERMMEYIISRLDDLETTIEKKAHLVHTPQCRLVDFIFESEDLNKRDINNILLEIDGFDNGITRIKINKDGFTIYFDIKEDLKNINHLINKIVDSLFEKGYSNFSTSERVA